MLSLARTKEIGNSAAFKVMSGKKKPKLARWNEHLDWKEILLYFRGSELRKTFTNSLKEDLKGLIKPQYVDQIPRVCRHVDSSERIVGDLLKSKDGRGVMEDVVGMLDLGNVLDRDINVLSGRDLQTFSLVMICVQSADVYMSDEPSLYLDVKQWLKTARTISGLLTEVAKKYDIVVEHDLAALDYLSDHICCLYGRPEIYGVVPAPISVLDGINFFCRACASREFEV